MVRMPNLEAVSIRGLPGFAICRMSDLFDPKRFAIFENVVQSVRLPLLRQLEVVYPELRTSDGYDRPRFDTLCCGSCRQLESIFDHSIGNFEILRLDLPPQWPADADAPDKVQPLVPPLLSNVRALWIKLPRSYHDLQPPYAGALRFPATSDRFRQARLVPSLGSDMFIVPCNQSEPAFPSFEEMMQHNPNISVSPGPRLGRI